MMIYYNCIKRILSPPKADWDEAQTCQRQAQRCERKKPDQEGNPKSLHLGRLYTGFINYKRKRTCLRSATAKRNGGDEKAFQIDNVNYKRKRSLAKRDEQAFTLIELLVVVALVAITVGVTGDIIITLTRSYNKTRVTNEIEQNSNFVMLKLEKELKNALTVSDVQNNSITFSKSTLAGPVVEIIYTVRVEGGVGSILRSYDGTEVILTDNSVKGGVAVDSAACSVAGTACFNRISTNPDVIEMRLEFSEAASGLPQSFTGRVLLENTVVVRGTY